MIIGNGSLAKLLQDREGMVLFASGVSNSQLDLFAPGSSIQHMMREGLLLGQEIAKANLKREMFVYFGTISSYYVRSDYINHKNIMEHSVRTMSENYTVLRLGNIWECTNPNTFINYMKDHPEAKVKDEYRYMISADQLNMVIQSLPLTGKHELCVFSEMLKVKDCLERGRGNE